MAKSARETALTILERCRRNQAFSDALLSNAVTASQLSVQDSALCARLCYGVLQNSVLCDFYIDSFAKENSNKIEPKVRDILRLSVYQILFLDKIPAHAAVSEGVELCKKSGFSRASGFVNAVLRKIASEKDNLPEIPRSDYCKYLSIKFSTPFELTAHLCSVFGKDFTAQLLQANNSPAPMTIQVNTLKTTAGELAASLAEKGVQCKPHAFLPDCFELSETGDIAALSEHISGMFYVQDAAARLAVTAAAPKLGDLVLDACSAPGGKSFAAAIDMKNNGRITSCDLHENKLKRVDEGAKRLGIDIISTESMDASAPNKAYFEAFDLVFADVPCSGLGVIRKKPDIRYKSLSDIAELSKTQLSILNGLASCVKKGGAMLYSTCTVLPSENEGVIEDFLASHEDFSAEDFVLPEPIGKVQCGMLSLYPHLHNTDGFFICKLRKHNEN